MGKGGGGGRGGGEKKTPQPSPTPTPPPPPLIRPLPPSRPGRTRNPEPPVDIADVRLPPVMLTDDDIVAFTAVVGSHGIDLSSEARIRHAGGRSTPDLLRRRRGEQNAPDAVIRPADHDEVRALLGVAGERGIAGVPYGGGTRGGGALYPERGAHHAVVSLDLRRLSGLLLLDEVSGDAVL